MNRTCPSLILASAVVLMAAAIGCSEHNPAGAADSGAAGTGGQTQAGTGGATPGTGGATTGTGGASGDAAAGTGGSGSGGAQADAAVSIDSGGSGGAGGATVDAPVTDGRADAAGSCPSAFTVTACVSCCDALYPGAFQQATFGNECLYCTVECTGTRICGGVTGGVTKDIDNACLHCAQRTLASNNCPFMSGTRCESFIACLKQCPTN